MRWMVSRYRCHCPNCGWIYQVFKHKFGNRRWVCKNCDAVFTEYHKIKSK